MSFIRKYTEKENVKIVEECLQYGSNSFVTYKYNINPVLLCKWKSCYHKYGQTLMPKILKNLIVQYLITKRFMTLIFKNTLRIF